MDGPLSDLPAWAVWLAGGALVVALVAMIALGWLTARTARALRRTTAAQEEAHAELAALRAELERRTPPPRPGAVRDTHAEYVITAVGESTGGDSGPGAEVERRVTDGRQFAAIALGESLTRLAVIGHGLRRALSPEARNRMAFEARREVRRSRRQRRDELRAARRLLQEQQRERLDGHPRDGVA